MLPLSGFELISDLRVYLDKNIVQATVDPFFLLRLEQILAKASAMCSVDEISTQKFKIPSDEKERRTVENCLQTLQTVDSQEILSKEQLCVQSSMLQQL